MLSTENHSDPSCSSNASALKSDERASDSLAFQGADPVVGLGETQPPNFSIRDYVFKSRSKDIKTNWPFPQQLLQLCLDHGIRDLLPPFEPPNLVRNHCFGKGVEAKQLPKISDAEQISVNGNPNGFNIESFLPSDQLVVGSSDQSRHPLPEEGELTVHQEGTSDDKLPHGEVEIIPTVTTHEQIKGISGEQLEKKCRLVVKLGTVAKTNEPEDTVSNLSLVSDPMASKVCPVCKTFTSTSNTTLNAHIDQCLSSECNTRRDVTKVLKHKVKPRKKRLMVDIYATAPHCTLEDLDRRNGTNWAMDLTLVALTNEITIETKRPKLWQMDSMDDGNEGEVYVDSNGTKLRILSKFNDPPPLMLRREFKLRKHGKNIKAGSSGLITKRKSFKPKCMKVNPQKEKLSSMKLFKGEIQAALEGDHHAAAHPEEEESLFQLLNARIQVKSSEPATLGQWVCSKRSGLSKKLNNKDIHKVSESTVLNNKKPLVESNQPDPGNPSVERSHVLKFSRSSDASGSSTKTKRVDILSNTPQTIDSGKKISLKPSSLNSKLLLDDSLANGLMPKLLGYDESNHFSLKTRKSSTLKKSALFRKPIFSSESSKVDKREKLSTTKKLRKHRSILGSSKWGEGQMHSDVNGALHSSTKDFGINCSENQGKRYLGMIVPFRSKIIAPAIDPCPSSVKHAEPISRSKSQIEPLAQNAIYEKEMQCRNAISNKIIIQNIQNGGFQSSTASFQEPSPCFTNQGETGLEAAQENSTITSVRVKSTRDHNLTTDLEPCGSPVSTTSTISPPSPEDCKFKDSKEELSAKPLIERKDQKVKMNPLAKEPFCSCSQSLSREAQLSRQIGKPMASNLFISPSTLSLKACTSLESSTESFLAKASSESTIKIPSPCSLAQTQTASNPILRLMGKDLVVNKEESAQFPKVLPCDSCALKANYFSLGFCHNSHHQIPALGNHQMPLQSHQRRLITKPNSSSQFGMERMLSPHQLQPKPFNPNSSQVHLTREVIMIDDNSPELKSEPQGKSTTLPLTLQSSSLMPQQPFSCIPSQNPFALGAVKSRQRENSGGLMFSSPSSPYFSPTLL